MTRFFLKLTIAAMMLSCTAADPLTPNTGETAPSVTGSRTLQLYGGAYTRSEKKLRELDKKWSWVGNNNSIITLG